MNIIVSVIPSFVLLSEHCSQVLQQVVRSAWHLNVALSKCSLSDYMNKWMDGRFLSTEKRTYSLVERADLSISVVLWGEKKGALVLAGDPVSTNETWGTSPGGKDFFFFNIFLKRQSTFFFQGLSSSLSVMSGGVLESLVTMRIVRWESWHAKDGSENIEPRKLIIVELPYLWISC